MKNLKYNIFAILLIATLGLMSCENEEESFSFTPGTDLIIETSSGLEFVGETGVYYVAGHTIDETYTWSASGAGSSATPVPDRYGEFVEVTATETGTVTLTVENDQGLSGSIQIDVVIEPEEE
ncbi:hypothetical protein SAMN05661096_02538 [Marivirga sericea]|uniref:BIG2 domain-containing protein n=1 Tax=Marivirga sericea TaxID=1028 RepID=A0A1X7KBX3_9BACT|nr:hypothetical protein [Marivirga sericea]SMG38401.1 hypothetical protein SAMN05661096_02538 [Marivirga sericea]